MRRLATGFTVSELLLVVGIISILVAVSTPLYVDWRATNASREVVAQIEKALSDARQDAKRSASNVRVTFVDGASEISVGSRSVSLLNGATIATSGPRVSLEFQGLLGVQAPFQPVSLEVNTGSGFFSRTANLTIIPPLAKTATSW